MTGSAGKLIRLWTFKQILLSLQKLINYTSKLKVLQITKNVDIVRQSANGLPPVH